MACVSGFEGECRLTHGVVLESTVEETKKHRLGPLAKTEPAA